MKWKEEELIYLRKIYPTNTPIREISKKINRSIRSIRHKASRMNLSRPNIPVNKPKDINHRKKYDKRYYKNNKKKIYKNKRKRIQNCKKELIKILGDGCKICGYEKCIAALEFHHKGSKKEGHVTEIIRNFSKQKALKEIKKCILLCANCHRELHYHGRVFQR